MRRLVLLPLLLLFLGCSQNHFNVPAENFASRVKMLGVAPIFIDDDSDIKHPQKEQLIALVTEANHTYEYQLARKLKETGNYFSVSLLDGDPRMIFSSLFFRREKRDDASIQYNKYFWKNDEIQKYIHKNNLDAVMLIVVSGLSKTDKIYSNTMLSSLTSEYNYLIMTAQIVDANGTVLWEYPNFRSRLPTFQPMIALQYPDFNEAEANISEKAEVKFKTIDGIKRRFNEKQKDLLRRETKEAEVYVSQFDEMVSLLKFDSSKDPKKTPVPEKARTTVDQSRPAAALPATPQSKPAVVSGPVVETPAVKAMEPKILPVEATGVPSDEIVPAADQPK
ncbi:MAG: hypothetical protein HXX11_05080 [Desulfuromonadales bacterium]|nr:hypothetical protein [Desulfuromonadales bacterium]